MKLITNTGREGMKVMAGDGALKRGREREKPGQGSTGEVDQPDPPREHAGCECVLLF